MEIKIKKLHENAVIPKYSKNGDGALDLTATSKEYDSDGNVVFGVGLAFEIPKGYVGLLFPRSSNAKKDLLLSNSVGVLDSGYRGEVMFKFKSTLNSQESEIKTVTEYEYEYTYISNSNPEYHFKNTYEIGDRIGQIIILPYPQIEFKEVEELTETERGQGGYGSTGN